MRSERIMALRGYAQAATHIREAVGALKTIYDESKDTQ